MKVMKLSQWVTQHRFSRGVAWFLYPAVLLAGITYAALINDFGIYPPPTSGTFAYNTFKPGAAGFPGAGGTYTDPVFGGVVKRLTNIGANPNQDDIYAHHWANANGTFAFARIPGIPNITIIEIATGNQIYTNQPDGSQRTDVAWDALDPDKYYFYSGTSLMRRNLAAQTNTTMKNFGAGNTLEANGGSLNTQSRDGRYFTVRYNGSNKLWDSQTDTIYSGSVPPLKSTGWVSITPDGNYFVVAAGNTGTPQKEHYSYPIDHVAKSIGSTPTQFWGLCGDHGVISSASDGKSYYTSFACHSVPGVYRVDITLNQAGRSEAQQIADNKLLVNTTFAIDGHLSAVSRGAFRDWVFFAAETESTDDFNSGVAGWIAYKQEIIAMQIVPPFEVRRLAHHRSRQLTADYFTYPRVSCSWDGSVVMWASNFNVSSPTGYADLYAIQSPLGTAFPTPQNLRFK